MTSKNDIQKRRGGRRKITQAEFIERATAAHESGAFDYSKAVYKTGDIKVLITCNTCGDTFEQTPRNHWNGQGCPACAGTKKLTTAEFIKRAEQVHRSDKYDYSKVEYKGAHSPVIIICQRHNVEFTPRPANFLNGSRCPACAKESHTKRALTTAEFIERCQQVHGTKAYDYTDTEYTNKRAKVKITCNTCDEPFEMEAAHHLKGGNCPRCAGRYRPTTAEFIERCQQVHGTKAYDYTDTEYTNKRAKVKITCNTCDEPFEQLAAAHIRGHGCPACNRIDGWSRSGFIDACKKNGGAGYLYVIKCQDHGERFYKIGITSNPIKRRFNGPLAMPYAFDVVTTIKAPAGKIYDLENKIKRRNKLHHYEPRRPFGGSARECFSDLTPAAVALLEQNKD